MEINVKFLKEYKRELQAQLRQVDFLINQIYSPKGGVELSYLGFGKPYGIIDNDHYYVKFMIGDNPTAATYLTFQVSNVTDSFNEQFVTCFNPKVEVYRHNYRPYNFDGYLFSAMLYKAADDNSRNSVTFNWRDRNKEKLSPEKIVKLFRNKGNKVFIPRVLARWLGHILRDVRDKIKNMEPEYRELILGDLV